MRLIYNSLRMSLSRDAWSNSDALLVPNLKSKFVNLYRARSLLHLVGSPYPLNLEIKLQMSSMSNNLMISLAQDQNSSTSQSRQTSDHLARSLVAMSKLLLKLSIAQMPPSSLLKFVALVLSLLPMLLKRARTSPKTISSSLKRHALVGRSHLILVKALRWTWHSPQISSLKASCARQFAQSKMPVKLRVLMSAIEFTSSGMPIQIPLLQSKTELHGSAKKSWHSHSSAMPLCQQVRMNSDLPCNCTRLSSREI